jgi:hypothetical protein
VLFISRQTGDSESGFDRKKLWLSLSLFWYRSPGAWIQFLLFGLPSVPISAPHALPDEPHGFSAWIRLTHFLPDAPGPQWSIDSDGSSRAYTGTGIAHPRLSGSDSLRSKVPFDRVWTAKDDARYISPTVCSPRLPAYNRNGALMALPESMFISVKRVYFRASFVLHKPMETACSHLLEHSNGCVERFR